MLNGAKQSKDSEQPLGDELNSTTDVSATADEQNDFKRAVESKRRQKLKSKKDGRFPPLFGLGMFGVIGWSIVLSTLAGIAFGVWIDDMWPSQISWTVTMLFVGVTMGCANAWYWLNRNSIL